MTTTFGAFAAGSLLVAGAGVVLRLGTTVSIVVGIGVGAVAAIGSYLRTTGRGPDTVGGPSSN